MLDKRQPLLYLASQMNKIERAIQCFKSSAQFSAAIGVSPQFVSQLKSGARALPIDKCPTIEKATDGKVTCDELRDDVMWVRVPDPDWPHHPEGRPLVDHTHKLQIGENEPLATPPSNGETDAMFGSSNSAGRRKAA